MNMDEFVKKYGGYPGPGLIKQAAKYFGILVVWDDRSGRR